MRAGDTEFGDLMFVIRHVERDLSQWTTPKRFRPLCGARTRKGTPCKAPAVWDKARDRPVNGRCRMHGGLSTGPKTLEGRLRALCNLRQFRQLKEDPG